MRILNRFVWILGLSLLLGWGTLSLLAAPVTQQAAVAPANSMATSPVPASTTITPETPLAMGNTGVTLTFASGASGAVTVTLSPTMPANPLPGATLDRSWFITTTAEAYAVTATFAHSQTMPVDVVLAVDKSGSMEFDTLCYGCWTMSSTVEYPDGWLWPLRWDGPQYGPPAHCAANTAWPYKNQGNIYTLIEAEEYSAISNAPRRYAQGYTYWVLQRNGKITVPNSGYLMNGSGAAARGRDTQGAYIGHFPFRTGYVVDGTPPNSSSPDRGASGVPCVWEDINNGFICRSGTWITEHSGPYPAPRVDFDFGLPSTAQTGGSNTWYVWIRAQGGDPSSDPNNGQGVFWGINGNLIGRGSLTPENDEPSFKYNGAYAGNWTWRRLQRGATGGNGNDIGLVSGATVMTHTLNIWAGSAGFTIDQIVITNDSGTIDDNTTKNIPRDTRRTNQACDPCDARFGGSPDGNGGEYTPRCDDVSGASLPPEQRYRYLEPIFDDEQPMASVTAATARFVRGLDISRDQVGLVRYSSRADSAMELLCLRTHGTGCTTNIIENNITGVLLKRGQTFADGATNIPDALEEATKMLSTATPHNGRPNAAPVIILLTDGQPNTYEYLDNENKNCDSGNLYPGNYDPVMECTIYMTIRARERGITIHTISLGPGADQDLLQAISDATGGQHYHAENPDALNAIYDEIRRQLDATPAPLTALYHRENAGEPWQMYPLTQTAAISFAVTGKAITALSEWTLGPLPLLVSVRPDVLPANRVTTATVTATVLQGYWNKTVPLDGVRVTFTASLGSVSPVAALTVGGVATATLTTGVATATLPVAPGVGQIVITATAEDGRQATATVRLRRVAYLPLVLRQ